MNIKQARALGIESGFEAGVWGDFTASELASREKFLEACSEICQNKRQYAGHPAEDFNRQRNADGLWDAFDEGESAGALKAWRERRDLKRGS